MVTRDAVAAAGPRLTAAAGAAAISFRHQATTRLIAALAVAAILAHLVLRFGLSAARFTAEVPLLVILVIGGVLFLLVEAFIKGKSLGSEVTWTVALAVGFGQLVAAVFPGTSRSGATILLALMLGLSRPVATEFSFIVSIPTMLAAGGWKILKALHHPPMGAVPEQWGLVLLGTIIAAVVSFVAVRWLLRYIQTHTFVAFGWYRIALAVLILAPGLIPTR